MHYKPFVVPEHLKAAAERQRTMRLLAALERADRRLCRSLFRSMPLVRVVPEGPEAKAAEQFLNAYLEPVFAVGEEGPARHRMVKSPTRPTKGQLDLVVQHKEHLFPPES